MGDTIYILSNYALSTFFLILTQTYIDPPPPDYDEVLKKAIECGAVLPLQATRYSEQMDTICAINREGTHQETRIDQLSSSSDSSSDSLASHSSGSFDCSISSDSSSGNEQEEDASSPPVASVTTVDETVSVVKNSEEANGDNDTCGQSGVLLSNNPVHSSREELLEEAQSEEDMHERNMEQCHHSEAADPLRTIDEGADLGNTDTVEESDRLSDVVGVVADEGDVMNTSQEELIDPDS